MVSFESLLQMLYEIQCLADPNDSVKTLKDRMCEIFEIASRAMRDSGWEP